MLKTKFVVRRCHIAKSVEQSFKKAQTSVPNVELQSLKSLEGRKNAESAQNGGARKSYGFSGSPKTLRTKKNRML